jgi:tetratricopeptide (TPR) repeat protein
VTAGRLALAARQAAHGVDHPATIPAMIALGVNLANAEKLAESERVLAEALDIGLQRLGPDHSLTLAVRDVIGWLAWKKGDYESALVTHEALLERRLEELGPDHALTAFARHNTALAEAALGRLETAEALMTDALATREVIRGPDHRTTAHSLHYLGLIRWNLGQTESATRLLERALATRRRLFYEQHPDVRRSADALAALRAAEPPFPVTPEH